MKPVKILLVQVLILGLICSLAWLIVPHLPTSAIDKEAFCVTKYLLIFENRLSRHQSQSSGYVIIGPSYAFFLGDFQEIDNLGFWGATMPEMEYLLRQYCSPDEHIFFFVSLLDVLSTDNPPRTLVTSSLSRRLLIARAVFNRSADIVIGRGLGGGFNLERKLSISNENLIPYRMILSRFPNTIFVMQPGNLEKFEKPIEKYRELLKESDLPVLDLSEYVSPDMCYREFFHLKPSGNKIVRELLVDIALNSDNGSHFPVLPQGSRRIELSGKQRTGI